MKTLRILAVTAAISACGADDEADAPDVVGRWYLEPSSDVDCGVALFFREDGLYEYDLICSLEGGGYGVEAYGGEYVVDGDEITLMTTHSSCEDATAGNEVLGYAFVGDSLRLASADGVLIFERLEDGGDGNGAAAFGCYSADGTFTQSPVAELE